jgi:GT2 family glycosyltransferase
MSVTIGITTRNRAGLLARALRSALEQDYPAMRLIVFDDASTDETASLRAQFPGVEWIRAVEPQGYMTARNTMMRQAGTDYYLSLDDDAWFLQADALAHAVQYLEADQRIAAVAYDILSPDRPDAKSPGTPFYTHMFIGCGHLLRLEAAAAAGYYQAAPGNYGGEEKDLCVRLLDRQYEIIQVPGLHVWHDKTILARDLPAQHRSGVCNDLVFVVRRCPFPLLLFLLPAKIVSHLRFSIRRGLLTPALQGLVLFIRMLPQVLASRQPVSLAAFRTFLRRSRHA